MTSMPARILLALCSLIAGLPSVADEAVGDGGFYAVSVADLDVSIDFYSEHLDFELRSRAGNDERAGALLYRPGVLLELAEFAGAQARGSLAGQPEAHMLLGPFKVGLLVTDLDAVYERLEAAGVRIVFGVVQADAGYRAFGIQDPDGNLIQLMGR